MNYSLCLQQGVDKKSKEREKEKLREPETIQVADDLALFRQYDDSLGRSVITVRHGSMEKLVSCLYTPYGHDIPNYVDTFLLTYRSFISPKQLLRTLMSAYPLTAEVCLSSISSNQYCSL